jgi:hypothetical protein
LQEKYGKANFLQKPNPDIGSLIVYHDEYLNEFNLLFEDIVNTKAAKLKELNRTDRTLGEELMACLGEVEEIKKRTKEYIDVKRKNIESESKIAIIDLKIKEITQNRNYMASTLKDLVDKFIHFNNVVKSQSGDYSTSLYFKMNETNLNTMREAIDRLGEKDPFDMDIMIKDTKTEYLKIKTDVERRLNESSEKIQKLIRENQQVEDNRYVQPFDAGIINSPKDHKVESRSKELIEKIQKLKEEKAQKERQFHDAKTAYDVFEKEYRKEKQELKLKLEEEKFRDIRYVIVLAVILIILIIIYIIIK